MWWRIPAALLLPPALVACGFFARYLYGLNTPLMEPLSLILGIAGSMFLLRTAARSLAARLIALVILIVWSMVTSLFVGLTIACRFADCL